MDPSFRAVPWYFTSRPRRNILLLGSNGFIMIEKRLTALGTAQKDSVEHEIHPSESLCRKVGQLESDLPRDTANQ